MTKRTMFVTAAAVFAVGALSSAAYAAEIPCAGANACKGQSACKTAKSPGKGQNSCKGQGFVNTSTTLECTVLKSR